MDALAPRRYREARLTGWEMVMGADVGCRRHIQAIMKRSQNAHGLDDDDPEGWTKHIEGACGELAAAKALGRYWGGHVGTYGDGDDILGCQVRTRSRHDWDLNIRPKDPDHKVFVLVTGAAPLFRVHGWLLAGDAKRPEYLQTHGNRPSAWFVPQAMLLPLETCPDPRVAADSLVELPDWLR